MADFNLTPGVYSSEYFSGSSAAIYFGDVWVDEVLTFGFQVHQTKRPIFGYADTLYRAVSKGQLLIQGSFTINFKEAGYLFLVLNRIRELGGKNSLLNPITSSQDISRLNIERIIDGESGTYADRTQLLNDIAAQSVLTGFPSNQRLIGTVGIPPGNPNEAADFVGPPPPPPGIGNAEREYEIFEDKIWSTSQAHELEVGRRADEPSLNGFDIYLAFGDFAGDNRFNHTIQKLTNIHITGMQKTIQPDGEPILETYSFIARNLI